MMLARTDGSLQVLSSGKEITVQGVACSRRHDILPSSQSACSPVNLGPSASTPTASPLNLTRSSLSPAQSPGFLCYLPNPSILTIKIKTDHNHARGNLAPPLPHKIHRSPILSPQSPAIPKHQSHCRLSSTSCRNPPNKTRQESPCNELVGSLSPPHDHSSGQQ